MRGARSIAVLLCIGTLPACAQLVRKKNLVAHLGAGGSLLAISSRIEALSAGGLGGGAIDFSFAYAFSPRWSLGFHYQRLGTDHYTETIDRVRITRYEVEGACRLLNRDRQALELTLGLGAARTALHHTEDRLPAEAISASAGIGARYLRMISNTMGAYAGFNASPGGNGTLSVGDVPVQDDTGQPVDLGWNSLSVTAGAFVRF